MVGQIIGHTGSKKNRKYLLRLVGEVDDNAVWVTKTDLSSAKDTVNKTEESGKSKRECRAPTSRMGRV